MRELRYLHEHEKQAWAEQTETHLLACHTTVEEAKALGETRLPSEVLEQLTTKYHQLIQTGLAAQPPPQLLPKQRGRVKQTKAKNLLDRLERDESAVLRFLSDFRVPFTNNGSEQDLRMSDPSNRKFREPFVLKRVLRPFAASVATSLPWLNKAIVSARLPANSLPGFRSLLWQPSPSPNFLLFVVQVQAAGTV